MKIKHEINTDAAAGAAASAAASRETTVKTVVKPGQQQKQQQKLQQKQQQQLLQQQLHLCQFHFRFIFISFSKLQFIFQVVVRPYFRNSRTLSIAFGGPISGCRLPSQHHCAPPNSI